MAAAAAAAYNTNLLMFILLVSYDVSTPRFAEPAMPPEGILKNAVHLPSFCLLQIFTFLLQININIQKLAAP